MVGEHTVHVAGASLIMIRWLASPVQSFLLKAVDFLLHFCLLQFQFVEFLYLSHIRFVRHGCQGSRARLDLLGAHHRIQQLFGRKKKDACVYFPAILIVIYNF